MYNLVLAFIQLIVVFQLVTYTKTAAMEDEPQPILPTTHGYIKGQRRTTVYDETYYSFEKIPYAKPPLGDLRFRAPVPADPWASVLDCTNFGDKPLQKNLHSGEIEGSEDCLYLNVYVKKLNSDKPLPVMVYIYGGAFQNGEATRDLVAPDYFMQEDVILVTLNYRLGPLGFLWLKDATLKIPGNAALKDQILALRWVKNNSINFNGDPNNITLFGESAGGASVHYLMLAKQTEGLFHKAIVMSGTVYNKWAHVPQGDYAYRLAKCNGYQGDNVDEHVLEFLMKIDGSKLMGHELMTEVERLNGISFVFGPTIEAYVGDDCVIPANPQTLLRKSWSNSLPVMIGGTSFEGLVGYPRVKANPSRLEVFNKKPELLVPIEKREQISLEESRELGKTILRMYMGDDEINSENILKYLNISSDRAFWHGFYRTILSRLEYAKAQTFVYRFDFDSPTFNLYRLKFCGPGARGVAHADDLSYLFYGKHSWKLDTNSEEYKTIRRMVGMWTFFAKNTDPNCPQIKPAIWEPVNKDEPNKCLNISYNVSMIELPEAERLEFWNSMYPPEELI